MLQRAWYMISSINGLKKTNKMNKLKEIKDLIEDLKGCVDGNGVPNIHYISNRISDLDKVVNAINYIPCCMELNNCFDLYEHVIYQGVDMMITFVDNCQKTANLYCSCDKTNWLGVSLNKLNKII